MKIEEFESTYFYEVNITSRVFEKCRVLNYIVRATYVKHAQRMGWRPEQTAKLINDKVDTVLKHYATPSRDEMG